MDPKWHKLVFGCPKCDIEANITAVSFAADATVLVEGVCPKCKIPLIYNTNFERTVLHSYLMDKNESGLLTTSTTRVQ